MQTVASDHKDVFGMIWYFVFVCHGLLLAHIYLVLPYIFLTKQQNFKRFWFSLKS